MSKKREVRAWKLTPIFDPEPGQIANAGTTFCIATGKYLLGTSVGEALSPEIVRQLRKTDSVRAICDAALLDAAAQFLRDPSISRLTVNNKRMTALEVADAILEG